MVAVGNEIQHLCVHRDELVLSQRLLLLSVNKSFRDFLLEVAGFDCVDDLQRNKDCGLH
jgi:hypothetical protein